MDEQLILFDFKNLMRLVYSINSWLVIGEKKKKLAIWYIYFQYITIKFIVH